MKATKGLYLIITFNFSGEVFTGFWSDYEVNLIKREEK